MPLHPAARSDGAVTLRPYRTEDAPQLLHLFRDSIRRVAAADYSPEQIRAWAPDEIDMDVWAQRFAGRFVVVAQVSDQLVGFAELEPDGHIDRVYVSADHQRQGIGQMLLRAVIQQAQHQGLALLRVEASITARPFFEAQGFTVITRQVVTCRGVELQNFRMQLASVEAVRSSALPLDEK